MKHIKTIILCLLATMICQYAFADTTTLTGKVTDADDGSPLIGVSVYLPELKIGAVTASDGTYSIRNLPKKKLQVQVSYLGHQTIIETVDLAVVTVKNFVMKEDNAMLDEVVIVGLAGNSLVSQTPAPVSTVPTQRLRDFSSANIIDAIAHQPGLSQITTGNGISKPVIRGLGYNRVAVVNDGVRQEGQQWGDEHGIEMDANNVSSVQILKGPASLIYGSDAMAGVIVMNNAPSVEDGHIEGGAYAEYQTNNGLQNYSLNVGGNHNGFVWDGRYSIKRAHDYTNRYDGRVFNSRFKEYAASGMVGLNKNWGHSHLHLSYYQINPGIVEGERDEHTGKFIMPVAVHGVEEVALYNGSKSYALAVPFQKVYHYKAVSENAFFIGDGQLKATIGYQQNIRKAFEDVLNMDDCELHLNLHTVNYNIHYLTSDISGWRIASGVNGMWQRNINKGEEYLVPDYSLFDFGIFSTATRKIGNWNLSGGLRFDNRHLSSKSLEEEGETRFEALKKNFQGLTGSIGATYHISKLSNLKLNMSRGFRAPNISELASNGEHEGTLRYEVGNHNLKPEHSLQFDIGYDFSSKYFSAQLAFFANWIDHYIYLQKMADEAGGEVMVDDVPAFTYTSGNARLWGGELMVDIHPWEQLHFQNSFSFVSAERTKGGKEGKYLPFTPAPRWNCELRYDYVSHGKLFDNAFIAFEVETHFKQNHFLALYGTETATPAYTLLNITAGTDIKLHGHTVARFTAAVNNLTDKAYQSHLSRLKYADVNLLTGRTGVFNMGRNFVMKLAVPFSFKL